MAGNVYVQFEQQEHAEQAVKNLSGEDYIGRPIMPSLSPVTNFASAKCTDYLTGTCKRGAVCNYVHPREISDYLYTVCYGKVRVEDVTARADVSNSRGGRRDDYGRRPRYGDGRRGGGDRYRDRGGDRRYEQRDHRDHRDRDEGGYGRGYGGGHDDYGGGRRRREQSGNFGW